MPGREMNIGILTYHRAQNYGAVLQAYALKQYLKMHGFSVEFIDYFPQYHQERYKNKVKRRSFGNLSPLQKIKYPAYLFRKFLPFYLATEKRRRNFIQFIKKYLIKNETGIKDIVYDAAIYGSDQIWRKQDDLSCPGFNDVYFGDELVKAKKRIAFSASMGILDLNQNDREYLMVSLGRFSAVSVREIDLYDEIKSFSSFPLSHTLDPVFLLDKTEWMKIASKKAIKQRYVLLYNLQLDKASVEIAEYVSRKLGLPIIELVRQATSDDYNKKGARWTDGPTDFISLVNHAEFIISSSFHGVAFSILFGKQFYACLPENQQRVISLLRVLGIEDRFVSGVKDIDLDNTIDYSKVAPIVEREKGKTIEFLISALEK